MSPCFGADHADLTQHPGVKSMFSLVLKLRSAQTTQSKPNTRGLNPRFDTDLTQHPRGKIHVSTPTPETGGVQKDLTLKIPQLGGDKA